MRARTVFLMLFAAACGGGTAAKNPDVTGYSSSKLASPELCEQAVTNYEKERDLSTDPQDPKEPLFDRATARLEHRRRVDRCTIMFSERQAACVANAPSLQYVQNCERFAELQ
jgi:hypothetical protein